MKNQESFNKDLEGLPKTITSENKHLFPKDFQDAFDFLEINKGKIIFKEKYYSAQRDVLYADTKALFEKSPDLSPKQVLLKIMQPLPDFLPAENLVEVTKIITTTWEELSKKVAA